jgi:hypothetical protein
MLSKLKLNQLYFKDTQFVNLMTKRIFNVLLVANPYDAFMLEDDGRIDEKIFNEYANLSLRYPPRFTQVSTEEEARKRLDDTSFDLVICMPGSDNSDTFDIARGIKETYPMASRPAWSTRTSPSSNTSSAGWGIPTCSCPSSS